MTDLSGRTALVTGSTQGIGLAVARELARAGAKVAIHGSADRGRAGPAIDELRSLGAPDARFFAADMRDPAAIAALMDAVEAWSPIDILVNNAGIQHTAPIAEMPGEKWEAIIAINLSAAFYTMQKALPGMAARGYGRVINIASTHGLVASVHKAPYVSAKHGLVGLTKVGALEYATAGSRESGGVTVNAICPGWSETPLIEPQIQARAAERGGDRQAGIEALLEEKQPTLRLTDPAEIGALAVWLCSPMAHNVTGTALPMDGGWTAR